jgi:hypothetical protein
MERRSLRLERRLLLKVATALLAHYVSAYVVLSANGGWRLRESGRIRWSFGMAVPDEIAWKPYGCWFQSDFVAIDGRVGSRGDVWGYFFSPLLALDCALIHRTKQVPPFAKRPGGPTAARADRITLILDRTTSIFSSSKNLDESEIKMLLQGKTRKENPFNHSVDLTGTAPRSP